MKKFLLSLAATAAVVTVAAPAAAQPWRGYDNGYNQSRYTTSYVDSLEYKINLAAQNRVISRQEARQLLSELRDIQPLAYRVQTGQARGWERQRLENGVARIESAVSRYARNDRWDRDGRWDNNGRDYGYRR